MSLVLTQPLCGALELSYAWLVSTIAQRRRLTGSDDRRWPYDRVIASKLTWQQREVVYISGTLRS